ncbi:DNA-binding response regulator [Paenibacillus agaridevorans]|uniref:DNA-binding response regulator n=1 Tax=Paenibacillus agaridevorans TaxID=171404 RepID=A0A2R5EZE1_9BACL|nr:response regulator [Paenibacillus agaridevorans]GBG11485.1 DNA-binding response regulator [Paenibacillus agaridevorans]
MMWKVLLVEDEPYIRRSLRKGIDWHKLGYEIIGEADDGEQALELIREGAPDLVIADIMMPVMDGLELLKQTRGLGLDTRFIMLTAVNEFEYAKEALEYGASGYILKLSMSIESLRGKLLELSAELGKRQSRRSERFHDKWSGLYSAWWQLYSARGAAEEDSTSNYVVDSEGYEGGMIVALLPGGDDSAAEQLGALQMAEPVSNTEIHSFVRCGTVTFFCWRRSDCRDYDRLQAWARTLREQANAVVLKLASSQPQRVREVWFRALDDLRQGWYGAGSRLPAQAELDAHRTIPWELEGKLIRYMELGKLDETFRILDKIWLLLEQRSIRIPLVKEEADRLEGLLLRIIDSPQSNRERLLLAASHGTLLHVLKRRLEEAQARRIEEKREYTDHPEINKIIYYIHENFDKEITLKSMAEYISMDEHYISGLFKRKTGDTLINFVQKHRIERAKQYLKKTDLPIHEISHYAGFANENYFSKIFRRWTQMTPSEYRKAKAHS